MKSCACAQHPAARRGLDLAGWLIPSLLLILIPKCPMCLAGYVALLTGLGLSFPAAAGLKTALTLVCAGALLFMAAWHIRRFTGWLRTRRAASGQAMSLRAPTAPRT